MNPNDITLQKVKSEAEKFLSSYHPALTLPIPIEEIAEIQLNVFIQLIPGIKELLGIDAFITPDFSQITIDEYSYNKLKQRTRFSITHELGHKILHCDWYNRNGPKNIKEALIFQERMDENTYKYMENQANTFAGLVLVPSNCLKREIQKIVGKKPPSSFLPPLYDLIDTFDVSEGVILRRMQNEGLIEKSRLLF